MKCSSCGHVEQGKANFCPNCGTPLQDNMVEPDDYRPLQTQNNVQSELVSAALSALDKNQGLFSKSVTLVFTSQRLLVANLDSQLMAEFHKQDQARLGVEGQRGLSKVLAMATSGARFVEKYLTMSPADILAERPGNYSINHADTQKVRLTQRGSGEDRNKPNLNLTFTVGRQKYKFRFKRMDFKKEIYNVLVDLYGSKLRSQIRY